MNKAVLILTLLFCTAAFAQRVQVKNVAVIETQIDERSGAASEINRAEVGVITNEIRREAVNNLPRGRFNVMTSETVQAMGAAVLEDCAEENCVIALGSKIGADYIVRGIISKFRDNFTVTIEMYETEYGMLVATAAPVRTANLDEILEKTTAACADMYKKFLEASSPPGAPAAAAPAPPPPAPALPPPPPPPPAPVSYTLAARANPSAGGSVTRSPNQTNYTARTPVTVTAVPADGYRFTGWSGALNSKRPEETLTINSNMSVTANFARVPPPPRTAGDVMADGRKRTEPKPEDHKKTSPLKLTMRISTATVAAGGFIGGAAFSAKANSEYDKYQNTRDLAEVQDYRKNTENAAAAGNVMYTLGWIGLSAFTLTLFF